MSVHYNEFKWYTESELLEVVGVRIPISDEGEIKLSYLEFKGKIVAIYEDYSTEHSGDEQSFTWLDESYPEEIRQYLLEFEVKTVHGNIKSKNDEYESTYFKFKESDN